MANETRTLDSQTMIGSNYEPKRQHLWTMELEGIPAFTFKSSGRPSITRSSVEIPYINKIRKYAGKTKFSDINITLMDPISPSMAQKTMEWVRIIYEAETGRAGWKAWYAKDVRIKMISPEGTIIESWLLKRAWLSTTNYNTLDYNAEAPMEIALTLTYDEAYLEY